jgi:hypothetical protein
MLSKYSLQQFYKQIASEHPFLVLEQFFHLTLAINDANYHDVVDELLFVKECKIDDLTYIRTLYQYLSDHLAEGDCTDLRFVMQRPTYPYGVSFLRHADHIF